VLQHPVGPGAGSRQQRGSLCGPIRAKLGILKAKASPYLNMIAILSAMRPQEARSAAVDASARTRPFLVHALRLRPGKNRRLRS